MGGGTIRTYGAVHPPPSVLPLKIYRETAKSALTVSADFVVSNLTMRRIYQSKRGVEMAGILQEEQPRIKTEIKIGNTTYIVNGYYASTGITVSEKIKRLLDKETK